MVLLLVNDGLIDLNATINTDIPNYDGPGKNRATIHQMLTHTSGIPNHGAIPNLSKKRVRWMYDSDQYLELVKETTLTFDPGTGFEYSGIAYNLLAIACEKVTKRGFAELLKQRVFIPLRMDHSSLNSNLDLDARRAAGYEYYLLDGYKAYSTRVVEDRVDIIMLENDYFRTDVGVKWCYGITAEIIDILAGKDVEAPRKSIAKAVGLTIGHSGIDKALAQLSALKQDRDYRISAGDYRILASELAHAHHRKQDAIRVFTEGLKDFPEDFLLTYAFAETLAGTDDQKATDLYRTCVRLYATNDANKRFSGEYEKALRAVSRQ